MNSDKENTIYKQRVKNVFNGIVARGWDTKGNLISRIKGKDNIVYDRIRQYGHDGMRLLDVGCATGRLLSFVDSQFHNCELWGIDISEEMAACARNISVSNHNSRIIVNDDFMEHDFGTQQYDIVILKFVLHHMADEEKTLLKAKQLLKQGGALLLYTPGKEHFKETFTVSPKERDILGRKSCEEIRSLFAECEMEICELLPCGFQMQIDSFDKFTEFLKRIGSYQKIVEYTDESWELGFLEEVKAKYADTEWHTGEYILAVHRGKK